MKLPSALVDLIDNGTWPVTQEQEFAQNRRPLVAREALQRLVPDEYSIYLLRPPFRTVRERIDGGGSFWNGPLVAITQISPERTLDIGSFGPGSDTVLALDYRGSDTEPAVIRLQWCAEDPNRNRWVVVAPSFDDFWRRLTRE